MHDFPLSLNVNNHNLERVVARQHYFRLRDKLVSLELVVEPNLADIDAVIKELEQAQLAYKATYGLFGNNPMDDSAPPAPSSANGQMRTGCVD